MDNNEILPKELLDVLDSPAFDHDAGMLIESVEYLEEDINLTFSIRTYGNNIYQLWQIAISGVEEECITSGWTQKLEIYSEHILLSKYTEILTDLYFKGTTSNFLQLFYDISEGLLNFDNNASFLSNYLFYPGRIKILSQQGYGLFASGPKTILKIYEKCLRKHGIKPIYIGEYEQPVKNKSLKMLMLGESYFIGQSFIFHKKQ